MGVVEFADEALQALRFFEWVEVFALDVFDQGERECVFVVHFFDENGDFVQSGDACGAVASFTGDDFVAPFGDGAHDDGLHQALFFDGFGQFVECGFVHVAARLVFARLDLFAR